MIRLISICLITVFLFAFKELNENMTYLWGLKTNKILDQISIEKLNSEDTKIFKKIISTRSHPIYTRIDSLYKNGVDLIYIIEEFDTKTDKITRIEKYFASKDRRFETFYSSEKNSLDSVQIPNFKFINDTLVNLANSHDPFYKENMNVVVNYWNTLNTFSYVNPFVESTIVTPGCSMTKYAVKAEEKRLAKKHSKPIIGTIYRIETLIKDTINISFQIPKKLKPTIHVIATTF